ncbi:MAG: alpha/beta hydrolase [Bacteroidales bacterium]
MQTLVLAQSSVQESLSFQSTKLKQNIHYSIYLPDDYNISQRTYPVLYLLHGYGDNETNWIQTGQMKSITDAAIANNTAVPMIIVMPNAWDTWYINQHDGKVDYEDMFFEEFIPHIEKTYRIRSTQESRAIAGLSMGGYGSLLYSLRHPSMFSACAPLSAAVFDDSTMVNRMEGNYKTLFERLFGKDLDHWKKNSIFQIISDSNKEAFPKTRYYIDCGDDDWLLEGNLQLQRLMREKNLNYEFRVRDGGHTWIYWRSVLPEVLHFVSDSFSRR